MAQSDVPGNENVSAPAVVLWESCREAEPGRHWREELSTLEAVRLLNEVRCFGRIAVLMVGRPLRRADVCLLIEHGSRIGLSMRLAPGPDPLYAETAAELRDAGLTRIVLDGDARPSDMLLDEIARARALGLGVHVTSTLEESVLGSLATRGRVLADAGVHVWTLAFPVQGAAGPRGAALDDALRKIVSVAGELPLQLEVAGAPQIRRILSECGADPELVAATPREGSGVLFIGADGAVQPTSDLPLTLGNVRHEDVVDLFRDAPVLCAMRDPTRLRGKCRACEFVYVCGGSRARAHAVTGDWLAPDPSCSYRSASHDGEQEIAVNSA